MIHTVGPVWRGGEAGEPDLLAGCYLAAMTLAAENGLESLAFPAISTGIYGFPPDLAAPIAVRTVVAALPSTGLRQVVFCCFSEPAGRLHADALADA